MKNLPRNSLSYLLVLTFGLAGFEPPSFAASQKGPDMTSSSVSSPSDERSIVESVPMEYFAALRDQDIDAVLSLYSEDGELSAPASPPAAGKQALRTAYEHLFKAVRFEMKHKANTVTIMAPTWAFVRTSSTGPTITIATGEAQPAAFEELFILRKEQDGKWRIAEYMTTPI